MEVYDIIIVGSGPSALALSQCLNKKRILIIEKEDVIGGCHSVRRSDSGLFSEHGPRVYSTAYKTFEMLLIDMGFALQDFFVPYKFPISTIGSKSILQVLTFYELARLAKDFIYLMASPDSYGTLISMDAYMQKYNFTEESRDAIDRICRLTDGAASDRYTLNQFLQLVNMNTFHTLLQPKEANDRALLYQWQYFLENKRGVEFLMNNKVRSVDVDNKTVLIENEDGQNILIATEAIVFAIPPKNLIEVLKTQPQQFTTFEHLQQFAQETAYLDYVSVSFHFDKVPQIIADCSHGYGGFTKADWGIVYIVLTDYLKEEHPDSKCVISVAATRLDSKSVQTGRTANETSNKEKLLEEIYDQLQNSFGRNLPLKPTHAVLTPNVNYVDGKWVSDNTAYVATPTNPNPLPFKIHENGIYTLGTHNGQHKYKFTSLESAVSNAVSLAHILQPSTAKKYTVKTGLYFDFIARIISLFVSVFLSIVSILVIFLNK